MDELQIELIYWINFYQSVYDMDYEYKPDIETIFNDHQLDTYLEDLAHKQRQKRRKATGG